MILQGELKEGDSLPSMRTLAKDLRISVITTKRAYEELEKDGFTRSFTGKGSFVSPKNIDLLHEENLKKIETGLNNVIELSRTIGLTRDELSAMFNLLYDGSL